MDGETHNEGSPWSTIRNAATAPWVDDTRTEDYIGTSYWSPSLQAQVWRYAALFDTSALGADTSILSATLSLYVTGTYDAENDGNDYLAVVTASPASTTALAADDYDQFGTVEQHATSQRKDITSISTSAYLDFILNDTGIGNIAKTGVTKFGIREGHDLQDDAPTVTGNPTDGIRYYTADQADTVSDPILVVEHIPSNPGSPSMRYIHPDHLGGTNVVTDANGAIVQTLDYYPYGSQRIATGSFDEQRRFIGEEYDPESSSTLPQCEVL